MANQTGFRQGRLGIGKNPIFPLDISGSIRIDGDLILGGTIADINGTPIEFGAATATFNVGTNIVDPHITSSQVPSWSSNVSGLNNNTITNGANYITADSTNTLTNKTISASNNTITGLNNNTITNGANYITASSPNTTFTGTIDFSTIPTINGTNVIKSGDDISLLTNNSGYLTSSSPGLWSGSGDIYYTGGDVGIGTSSPSGRLQINSISNQTNNPEMLTLKNYYNINTSSNIVFRDYGNIVGQIGTLYDGTKVNFTFSHLYNSAFQTGEIMRICGNGNVGIGITDPTALLHINTNQTHSSSNFTSGYYIRSSSQGGGAASAALDYNSTWSAYTLSILAEGGVYAKTGYIVASDERIKESIVDVPDNLALQMVRDIPCRYYEYIDKARRGAEKTIGFIAQEVAEVLPMAISIQKDIIPNEMRILTDISWNGNTLHTDLQDVSGVKYRFYVSNDVSGNDEVRKEVIGNPDNTFIFDTSYNNVFCYGKEVDDFHTLDKNKLFALNFSATQELDRQQQADKARIVQLETTVQLLMERITALENNATN